MRKIVAIVALVAIVAWCKLRHKRGSKVSQVIVPSVIPTWVIDEFEQKGMH